MSAARRKPKTQTKTVVKVRGNVRKVCKTTVTKARKGRRRK